MNPKLLELVQNLLAGTKAGTFQWTETPEPGVYRLLLYNGLVRIHKLDFSAVGFTVLNADGMVLHTGETSRAEGGPLVELSDLVDGSFQEGALDDLLAEVRTKVGSLPILGY